MLELWHLFLAFFIPGIVGYGGGPASIPLIEHEVVNRYGWMSTQEFGEVLALANALPGPIATKMAAFVGWEVAGVPGVIATLFATVGPSLAAMLLLMSVLLKYKDHPRMKKNDVLHSSTHCCITRCTCFSILRYVLGRCWYDSDTVYCNRCFTSIREVQSTSCHRYYWLSYIRGYIPILTDIRRS